MIYREFTEDEIQQALLIPDINARKDFLQNVMIDYFAQHGNMIISAYTGWGKSYMCKKTISRFRKKFDDPINIIVPKKSIQKSWLEELEGIPNIRNFIINSYTRKVTEENRNCGILIIDETHWAAGKHSKYYSQTIPITKAKRKLLLSATLRKDQIEVLERYGIKHCFKVPLETGYKLGVVPIYYQFNVPVQFTPEEQSQYIEIQEEYTKALKPFELVDEKQGAFLAGACLLKASKTAVWNGMEYTGKQWAEYVGAKIGWRAGEVIGTAIKWQTAISNRKILLQNTLAKQNTTVELLQRFKDQRVLVFAPVISIAEDLAAQSPSGKAYHSKITEKKRTQLMQSFASEEFNHLISCSALKEGVNVPNISVAINAAVNAQMKDAVQILGRVIRYEKNNPDKVAVMINLYVDDFTYNGIRYESQEKKWLKSSQWNQPFIQWLSSLNRLYDELLYLNIIEEAIEEI